MRVLCICNHGNVRSVALAMTIKNLKSNWEAIAIGAHYTTKKTHLILSHWADLIISICEENKTNKLLKHIYGNKLIRLDLGQDIWGSPFHPDLLRRMKLFIERLNDEEIAYNIQPKNKWEIIKIKATSQILK